MTTLLITIHVLSCLMLILVVLLQAGRGADMGAAFGGASSPMFGSGSSTNPLTRMTTITAVLFLTTALFLAVSSARRASVFDDVPEPLAAPPRAESSAPAASPPASGDAADVAPAPIGEAQPLTIPAAPAAGGEAAPDAPAAPAAGGEAAPETAPAASPPAAAPAIPPAAGAPASASATPPAASAPVAPPAESAPPAANAPAVPPAAGAAPGGAPEPAAP